MSKYQNGETRGDKRARFSSIIERMNDLASTYPIQQFKEDMKSNEKLAEKAKNNTKDNFKFSYEKAFMDFVIDRMQNNEKFFMKVLEDHDFKEFLMDDMFHKSITTSEKTTQHTNTVTGGYYHGKF